jgi:hypothetical protein
MNENAYPVFSRQIECAKKGLEKGAVAEKRGRALMAVVVCAQHYRRGILVWLGGRVHGVAIEW